MNTDIPTKINSLLAKLPTGVVYLSSWLADHDYSHDLQKSYRKSKWLTSIGNGAMIRFGAQVGYQGAIYSLQEYAKASIHLGAKTALGLSGKSHYLEMNTRKIVVFGAAKEELPTWFKRYDWGMEIDYHTTSMLPPETGLTNYPVNNFEIRISGVPRAMMECLHLAQDEASLMECYELMEGLNNLVPQKVETLLQQCTSVKVKRLFLYFAEKAGHAWFSYLKTENIDLGKGKRSLVSNGIYIPKYQITVPKI